MSYGALHKYVAAGLLLGALLTGGCTGGFPAITGHARDLQSGVDGVQAALRTLDADLRVADSRMNHPSDLGNALGQEVISGIVSARPYVVFCATLDPKDKIVAMSPAENTPRPGETLEAASRYNPSSVAGEPVLSLAFADPTSPGVLLADLLYPLATQSGAIFGSLRVRLNVTQLLRDILQPITNDASTVFWVLQTDGTTLYDPDNIEIGRNVFTDMMYTPFEELTEVARRIVNAPTGYGQYKFIGTGIGTAVRKYCNWQTATLYGASWRVILVREVG